MGSLFSSDPSRIMTRVSVMSARRAEGGARVHVIMEAHLVGQLATTSDMVFWRHELDSLSHELRTGEATRYEVGLARRAARLGILVPSLVVLAPLMPFALMALWFGLSGALVLLYMSTVVGLMALSVGWLRKGMPSVSSLSVEAPLSKAGVALDHSAGGVPGVGGAEPASAPEVWAAPELAGDAETRARLELEDFDKRLFGDDERASEPVAEEAEVEAVASQGWGSR